MKKISLLIGLCMLLLFALPAFADQYSTITVTAADNCTDELYAQWGSRINTKLVPNSNTALTIVLENKFPDESSWAEVDSWVLTGTSKDQVNTTARPEQENVWYRLRCSSYTSGNCTARIGH